MMVPRWCRKFGPAYAHTQRWRQGRFGDIWHVDELFIPIRAASAIIFGERLTRMVTVLDILVHTPPRRESCQTLLSQGFEHWGRRPWQLGKATPGQLVTDKPRSYPAAHREALPSVIHRTGQYENNRAEVSPAHQGAGTPNASRFKPAGQPNDFPVSTGPN
jgi:putative transposase